jgi:phytoene dehydrogenase-like protein
MKSPVKGLYHVGHWTRPGTGVTSAILSGWMLANRLNSWVGKYLDKMF